MGLLRYIFVLRNRPALPRFVVSREIDYIFFAKQVVPRRSLCHQEKELIIRNNQELLVAVFLEPLSLW